MAKRPGEPEDTDVVDQDDRDDGPEDTDQDEAEGVEAASDEHDNEEEVVEETEEGEAEGERPKPSRANDRVRSAIERAKAAERKAAEAEARAQAAERARQQPSAADLARAEAEERARVELMSADEKLVYYRQKDEQKFNAAFGQLRGEIFDSKDAASFEAECVRKPHLAEIADEVEKRRADIMRTNGGIPIPRKTIALYLIGERADQRAAQARTKQGKRAAARVESATPRNTGNSRGDQTRNRRETDERAARRKRLENQPL